MNGKNGVGKAKIRANIAPSIDVPRAYISVYRSEITTKLDCKSNYRTGRSGSMICVNPIKDTQKIIKLQKSRVL